MDLVTGIILINWFSLQLVIEHTGYSCFYVAQYHELHHRYGFVAYYHFPLWEMLLGRLPTAGQITALSKTPRANSRPQQTAGTTKPATMFMRRGALMTSNISRRASLDVAGTTKPATMFMRRGSLMTSNISRRASLDVDLILQTKFAQAQNSSTGMRRGSGFTQYLDAAIPLSPNE